MLKHSPFFPRRKRRRSHSWLRMRSKNIVEEGVNGLRLFAKLSISLRTESSLQVRFANVKFSMELIDSIVPFHFHSFHFPDISYMACRMHRILSE